MAITVQQEIANINRPISVIMSDDRSDRYYMEGNLYNGSIVVDIPCTISLPEPIDRPVIDPTYCSVDFSTPWFRIPCGDTGTGDMFLVDRDGNAWFGAVLAENQSIGSDDPANSLIVKDGGTTVAYWQCGSNVWVKLAGSGSENGSVPTSNVFLIESSGGTALASVDTNGNFYCSGEASGVEPVDSHTWLSDQCSNCCGSTGNCALCRI